MGLFASKKQKQEATRRTEPVVRYSESPETQWMRDEMVRGVFNWYVADKPQHGEALWGIQREMTHYFEEVECRLLTVGPDADRVPPEAPPSTLPGCGYSSKRTPCGPFPS
ncbi:hypothetical protein DIPPA_14599 [Diplonema papillatum]|nr:hypothetical protein DIPPA_14599 [Diplonema papillatum]